ncbi:MAG: class I SAM-dependent methyltransferase [Sulfurospirillaceae bacterium]|nr:class I SAM-dependent methyltransferase [Sulfurospirillaceae bacterium]
MTTEQKDYFAHKAKDYEKEVARTGNVNNIADTILKEICYSREDHLMDFGSGTGLLLENIAPHVKKITAVDMSEAMNTVLRSKAENIACELEICHLDLSKDALARKFDGIISSMTIHHVKDIKALFEKFHDMLEIGGTIALADLDSEDGTFHKEDTGVFHFGFERDMFLDAAKEARFKNLKIQDASIVQKPYGEYSVFLLTGEK